MKKRQIVKIDVSECKQREKQNIVRLLLENKIKITLSKMK
jgi:hypothetical protein